MIDEIRQRRVWVSGAWRRDINNLLSMVPIVFIVEVSGVRFLVYKTGFSKGILRPPACHDINRIEHPPKAGKLRQPSADT
jgi:hypothetical protein